MPARASRNAGAAARRTPVRKATPAEVAAYLRRTEETLANWRWQGKGPRCTKPGRGVLYDWADVYEWEESQPSGGAGRPPGAA